MVKEIWLNLPVKDIQRSREFFTQLGFTFNDKMGSTKDSACMLVGSKNVVVMLFTEEIFRKFTQNKTSDATQASEILISVDAENRAEVDEMAKKAEKAGGIVFGKPGDNQGWLYGCGFSDPDGHRWNVLYMDLGKMPKG